MQIAFFSDIHGNLPALEIAINKVGKVDGYIILGDTVNYGPWSNECVDLIETLPNCIKLLGNHEEFFIKGEYGTDNYLAKIFFDHCYATFSRTNLIKNYLIEAEFNDFICSHTIGRDYVYPDSDIKLYHNHIIGHSHKQFEIERNGYKLINPGSLGQNRTFINEINYMIFDTRKDHPIFLSSIYNVDVVLSKMREMNYPQVCINYYNDKKKK
jgi:putative phosphoesterase